MAAVDRISTSALDVLSMTQASIGAASCIVGKLLEAVPSRP